MAKKTRLLCRYRYYWAVPDAVRRKTFFAFKNRFVQKAAASILHETICHHLRDYFGCQMPPGIFVPRYTKSVVPYTTTFTYAINFVWKKKRLGRYRQTPAVKVLQRLFFCVAFQLVGRDNSNGQFINAQGLRCSPMFLSGCGAIFNKQPRCCV